MFVVNWLNLGLIFDFKQQTLLSLFILGTGIIIVVSSARTFKKARTTINPTTPELTTNLVTTGFYRLSRNPMYLSFLLGLLAGAVFTGNLLNILFLPLYIVCANKLYIIPEEQALQELFGAEFVVYSKKVGRWV